MNRLMLLSAMFSIALGSVSGCTTSPSPMMGSGHTPAYADGFSDGCQSGRWVQNSVAGSQRKDVKRFDTDKQYAEGWTAGYKDCWNSQMQEDASGNGR
jgi:hypothetical protein